MTDQNLKSNFELFINKYKEKFKGEKIALAISGGSDSLALAYLANKYKNKYNYNIIAFTLDHQLRKESAEEANHVKNIMSKLKIEHHSLIWSEEKPKTKIQETARIARYNILGKACKIHNCKYVFLGHHANDQVETFIIRLNAKSGLEGLGCMKEISKILTNSGKLKLVRPLLSYKKDNLIKICNINNLKWIEDPSNSNLKYLRSKTRKLLVHNDMFDDHYKAISLFKRLNSNINDFIYNFINNEIEFNELGICKLKLHKFKQLPIVMQLRLLNYLLKIIGGKKYPRKSRILNNLLQNIKGKNSKNSTVGGAYIKIGKDNITLSRQLDNTLKTSQLNDMSTLWDRRFLVLNKTKKNNITIGPLGEKDYLSMIKLNKIQKPSINFNAIKTIPAIRVLEQIVSVPHLLYWKNDFWKNNIKITHIEYKLFKKYKNIDIFKLGEKI